MAHPDRASVELPGRDTVPVTPHRLDGANREQAWQRITAAQPRYAKYQRKTDQEYPVIRLTLRRLHTPAVADRRLKPPSRWRVVRRVCL
jgi:F420H(2)-dependent quinone reductase